MSPLPDSTKRHASKGRTVSCAFGPCHQVITFIINGLIFFYVGASAVNFTIRWAARNVSLGSSRAPEPASKWAPSVNASAPHLHKP